MARKTRTRIPSPTPSSESYESHDGKQESSRKRPSSSNEGDSIPTDPPSSIDPYLVLGLTSTATADEIKSAYRKSALKNHPDKASAEEKDAAHIKFQEIAFAYAILSDEKRRRRYDTTGNTSESLDADDDDFNWVDFFREQTAAMVSGDMIEQIKREYQGSEEERGDVLRVYEETEGDMDALYEEIMCSTVLDDDTRFREIIDSAINGGEVEEHDAYIKETKASRRKRLTKAKAEENEAMELAEELGVKDKLFGRGNGTSGKDSKGEKKAKGGDEDALKALIQQRQKNRGESFLDQLEAKYAGGSGKVSGKGRGKRKVEEPPEELFQQNTRKMKRKV